MEVRSNTWQKSFATLVFVLMASFGIAAALAPPGRGGILCGLALFAIGFYLWWSTVRCRLYMNDDGVGVTDGFRRRFVRWDEISFYTMEAVGSYRQTLIEPVLFDAHARTVFRPIAPTVISSAHHEDRALFWRLVTERIDERKKT